jgi:soluble lytic murein transglycosylase-like protein
MAFRPASLSSLLVVVALVFTATASYTVQPGDTLSEIAERFGVTVSSLTAVNGLADPHRVRDGVRLTIPGAGAAAGAGDHLVAPGETLSGIAASHGVSVAALAAENGIAMVDLVREGRRLRLPAASAPSAAAAPAAPARIPRAEVGALLDATARRYGVDPATVKALAWQESGWNQGVVSSANAIGIMQVLPSTGRFVSGLVGRPLDLSDPADNVEAGVAFLRYLDRLTGGDQRTTLAGYYQGLASLRRNGAYPDTERYIDNVLALRRRFS